MARHLEPGGVRVIVSRRDGAMSVLRFHYAVAAGGDIATADERHELRLFTHGEYAAAFLEAGLDTTWDPEGLTGRGLLIGVAPG